jgi:toxin ParE1/3/4
VPRLVFLTSAQRDLAEIAAYIERESQSRHAAEDFADKITAYCERLAALPTIMGRARPELRTEYRSVVFGNYVIFLRYVSEGTSPLDMLQVIHVLHGARDLDAYFRDSQDQ